MQVLSDAQWAVLSPLIEACRPKGKMPLRHLRRTIEAILWRHQNGATWRAIPEELGPWWAAAQTFIRWSKLGVWERLLDLAQAKGVALGMVFFDATNIPAHHKTAGVARKGALQRNGTYVMRLDALVAAMAPRPVSPLTDQDRRLPCAGARIGARVAANAGSAQGSVGCAPWVVGDKGLAAHSFRVRI